MLNSYPKHRIDKISLWGGRTANTGSWERNIWESQLCNSCASSCAENTVSCSKILFL